MRARHAMRALALCGVLLGTGAQAQAPNGFSKARLARIDSAFDRWIADGRIAGIVALVTALDCDAIRNIASVVILRLPSRSAQPRAVS